MIGCYRYGVGFYQYHWDTMGEDTSNVVLKILHDDGMNQSLNSTHLVLIPKKHKLDSVSDFRPISLCNVLYKLVFKVISIRLKPFMLPIISHNQSAFIPS